jgi:hypothetical protein
METFTLLTLNTMPTTKTIFKYLRLTILFAIAISNSTILLAQNASPGINFQAIARDKEHNAANNRKVYIECTIENGLTNPIVVYGEHQEVVTNEFGVFNLVIGKGVRFVGVNDIYAINWANGKYYFHLRISITPVAPDINWDYTKEWVDLGAVEFGVVPYAIQSLSGNNNSIDTASLKLKLNIADTSKMLLPYRIAIASIDSNKYITPYQLSKKTFDTLSLSNRVNAKLNISDTNLMLLPYRKALTSIDSISYVTPYQLLLKTIDTFGLSNRINGKLNITDTAIMLMPYHKSLTPFDTSYMSSKINLKLNISDTSLMLSNRIGRDTLFLSTRMDQKEDISNKSVNMNLVADFNDTKYPTVKAIKTYVDASLIAGAPDATTTNKGIIMLGGDLLGTANAPIIAPDAITTIKILDGSVTDAKLASGINASKVGLGNLTNNAQLYSLNGLTTQVQNFGTLGTSGLAPNWVSSNSTHVLNIPLASATAVTAGLISKIDYDHFYASYNNDFNALTSIGTAGAASINGQVINIPNYSLIGLAGNVNANSIFAGPVSGASGSASFRNLVAADIPNNTANTSGNAATASKLLTARYLNNILFDGSTDMNNLTASTPNALSFSNSGTGVNAGESFNGSIAKDISYNSIGAAPSIGSNLITTLGSISSGTWAANIIGANYGGAGANNGLLKANGSGLVSTAVVGTDYIAPFGSQTAKYIYAAPNASNGNPIFRLLVASDIPTLNQNTTGNANTATVLANSVNINGVAFDGSTDITITSNTSHDLNFINDGTGLTAPISFNGASAKLISYNSIGAAPAVGSTNITTLGSITTGAWAANIIGANYGGAGNNNGLLKANGAGVVSVASAGSDFQSPLLFVSPLINTSNSISIPAATNSVNGYLTNTDWALFNNKIDLSQKASVNGVASLDANGKIPTSQIPAISFSSGYVVTSESAMLALSNAVVGSIAIRTDNSKNYVLSGLPASTLANWLELLMPVSVSSVNGHTESNISLTTTDIAEGTNLYFTNTKSRNAISAVSPIVYTASTGVISMSAATTTLPGYLTATDWNLFNNKIGAFSTQTANSFYAGPTNGSNALPLFRAIVAADIPTLNQNTTGNAATATKLAATKNINGVAFDGSSDITIASTIMNAVTFNSTGAGTASPVNFDGSVAKTISYNTIGAAPAAGATSITTLGNITTGTWSANIIDANKGGAGLTNGLLKADGSGNVSAAVAGSDFIAPFASQTSKYFYAAPNAANGVPVFRSILASDIPTLNQNTTGNAGTASKLFATKNINGVPFDGSGDITIYATVGYPITFDNSGAGGLTTTTFNGSIAKTISYNTIGAAPAIGSNAISQLGTVASGTWAANIIGSNYGGAGAVTGILKANGSGVVSAAVAGTDFENPLSFTLPLSRSANTISMTAATTTTHGYLTNTDWNFFNSKQSTIVAGTGVGIAGGNTISIGQSVATTTSPSFVGATLTGLNTAGVVTNSAAGALSTNPTTGTGNIVRANSPTLVTPILGDATATSVNVSGDITAKRFKLTMPSAITAASTTTIDLSTGNVFTVNMGLNIATLTLSNPVVGTYLIKFVQDATGTRDVSFPTAWKWAGGVIPSLTNTANKLDIVTLIYDGTTYYTTIVQNF